MHNPSHRLVRSVAVFLSVIKTVATATLQKRSALTRPQFQQDFAWSLHAYSTALASTLDNSPFAGSSWKSELGFRNAVRAAESIVRRLILEIIKCL